MVGWETLSDAVPTTADLFGGQYLNRLTQLMLGADISATDTTLKPVIGTDWTFKSGKLFLIDVAGTHTVNLIPDTQSVNTVIKTPAQSFTPDYISLRKQSEELENKVVDSTKNVILNVDNGDIATAAAIAKTKLAPLNIVDSDVSIHTSTKISIFDKTHLPSDIIYSTSGGAWNKDAVETLTHKTIDYNANTILNLPPVGGGGGGITPNSITDSDIAPHTTTKITTTNKALLNSQIAYKDATLWLTDAMVSATAAIAKTKLAALNIVDADVSTHTTTKISTTNKALLNSAIVYNDQANTYGAFDQLFKSGNLKIRNPGNTFSGILALAAITAADRTYTFPNIASDGTVSLLEGTQTSTGLKTFSGGLVNTGSTNATRFKITALHTAGVAEQLYLYTVDDATSSIFLSNQSATDAKFVPALTVSQLDDVTLRAIDYSFLIGAGGDSGSNQTVVRFNTGSGTASTPFATRALYDFCNGFVQELTVYPDRIDLHNNPLKNFGKGFQQQRMSGTAHTGGIDLSVSQPGYGLLASLVTLSTGSVFIAYDLSGPTRIITCDGYNGPAGHITPYSITARRLNPYVKFKIKASLANATRIFIGWLGFGYPELIPPNTDAYMSNVDSGFGFGTIVGSDTGSGAFTIPNYQVFTNDGTTNQAMSVTDTGVLADANLRVVTIQATDATPKWTLTIADASNNTLFTQDFTTLIPVKDLPLWFHLWVSSNEAVGARQIQFYGLECEATA